MNAFVRVVETGSFPKAAGALGVSRATISVSVQQLEDPLGVRLLHRTTRRVSLTSEGETTEAAYDEMAAPWSTSRVLPRRSSRDDASRSRRWAPDRWTHRSFTARKRPSALPFTNRRRWGGQLTKIEDIVPIVKHLVTDAWWITGQAIFANGGYTTR